MAEAGEKQKQVEKEKPNAAVRLMNLPLVNSAFNKVSSAYENTKDNNPRLKSVCDVTEKKAKTITSVAMTTAKPILQTFEPQIALANTIASVGLDLLEENLPILHQPSDKAVASASEAVVGAKDAAVQSITGAVQGIAGRTKAVGSGSINTVLGNKAAKKATKTEDAKLSKDKPSFYGCLESFSSKVLNRAHQQVMTGIKDVKNMGQKTFAQIQNTLDLVPDVVDKELASETDSNPDTLEEELQDSIQASGCVIKKE
ncbi:perilipin-2-like [Eleutherodactylus coqui]|uniref:perilipin-2-like n=1 Tax=Eleutherodactylus coqui TaxID=57060 RepID=UPI0034636DE8